MGFDPHLVLLPPRTVSLQASGCCYGGLTDCSRGPPAIHAIACLHCRYLSLYPVSGPVVLLCSTPFHSPVPACLHPPLYSDQWFLRHPIIISLFLHLRVEKTQLPVEPSGQEHAFFVNVSPTRFLVFFKGEKVNSILVCRSPGPSGNLFFFPPMPSSRYFFQFFTMSIDTVIFPIPAVATAAPFAEDEAKVAVDTHTTRRLESAWDDPESGVSFYIPLLNKGILDLLPLR